jgi:hypothetical protein
MMSVPKVGSPPALMKRPMIAGRSCLLLFPNGAAWSASLDTNAKSAFLFSIHAAQSESLLKSTQNVICTGVTVL